MTGHNSPKRDWRHPYSDDQKALIDGHARCDMCGAKAPYPYMDDVGWSWIGHLTDNGRDRIVDLCPACTDTILAHIGRARLYVESKFDPPAYVPPGTETNRSTPSTRRRAPSSKTDLHCLSQRRPRSHSHPYSSPGTRWDLEPLGGVAVRRGLSHIYRPNQHGGTMSSITAREARPVGVAPMSLNGVTGIARRWDKDGWVMVGGDQVFYTTRFRTDYEAQQFIAVEKSIQVPIADVVYRATGEDHSCPDVSTERWDDVCVTQNTRNPSEPVVALADMSTHPYIETISARGTTRSYPPFAWSAGAKDSLHKAFFMHRGYAYFITVDGKVDVLAADSLQQRTLPVYSTTLRNVTSADITPDGQMLAIGTESEIHLWWASARETPADLVRRQSDAQIPQGCVSLALSLSYSHLWLTNEREGVRLLELPLVLGG